jgi:nucleoside-diphosphate-sugar epimerase
MKRVLITGKNSYVGTNVEKWLIKEPDKYYVETISLRDPNWKDFDFSKFDVVFHVAGIAHISKKKSMENFYYKVNRDLTIETAKKAKESGVKQFIFMSSMIIFGEDNSIDDKSHIDINKYNPLNAYGNSKLEADLAMQKLQNERFLVVIVRTPVIYGPKCKGNFPKLLKMASMLSIVPDISNQRSMIYIDNFSEFIKQLISKSTNGVFYPQNSEYMSTTKIIFTARKFLRKRTIKTRLFNWPLRFMSKYISYIRKAYGNKTYELNLSIDNGFNYNVVDIDESIQRSIST